ncbi:MAG TPA: DUF6249 domain-containing protein [Ignavibacteria bacterium]|nr:DUF6249 domain-containing protein [Ignavibacteria bacterium]
MNDLFEGLIPIMAILATFGIPGIIIIWYIYTNHREKMRLIESGLSPEEIKSYFSESEKKPKNPYSSLKWGILFLFFGIGIFLANIFISLYDLDEGIAFGIVFICGGLGLIVYYLIVQSKMKDNKSDLQKNQN